MGDYLKFWLAKTAVEVGWTLLVLTLIVAVALVHYWLTRPRRRK